VGLWHSGIRQVTTNLLAELDFFQGHVFNSRLPVIRRDLLPCVRIYTSNDQRASISQMNSTSGYLGMSLLTVQITVEAAADPAASDLLDLYCEAVEIKLLQSQEWLCFISLIPSVDTLFETDVQGEMRTITASITFALKYLPVTGSSLDSGITGVPVITDTEGQPLGELESILLMIDAIDPAADPNTTGHPTEPPDGYPGGYPGPDGRIEVKAFIPLPVEPVQPEPPPEHHPPAGSGITTRRVQ
jgi:hypothetical protein